MTWKFRTYKSGTGRNDTQIKINGLNEVVKEHFLTRLRYLQNTPQADWHEPHAKKLKGKKEIYEIRFQANNVQHRQVGYFGPGKDEFTILIWCTHKQNRYDPTDALDTATTRLKQVKGGAASTDALKVDGADFPSAQ